MTFNDILDGLIGHFVNLPGMMKKGVLKEVRNAVRRHHGKGEDEKVNRLGHPIFNLETKYVVEEVNYLNCAKSDSFELLDYLKDYMTGSKIVFQRATFWQSPSNGSGIYSFESSGWCQNRRDRAVSGGRGTISNC